MLPYSPLDANLAVIYLAYLSCFRVHSALLQSAWSHVLQLCYLPSQIPCSSIARSLNLSAPQKHIKKA